MRKIDTWLFIAMFVVLYSVLFWLAAFTLIPLLTPIVAANTVIGTFVITLVISSVAYFLTVFGLRSYFLLPTTLFKLVNSIVLLQLTLNVLSIFFEKPTLSSVGSWLLTAVGTWCILYVSFMASDRYFGK